MYSIGSVYIPLLPKLPYAAAKIDVLPPSLSLGELLNCPKATAAIDDLEAALNFRPSFSPYSIPVFIPILSSVKTAPVFFECVRASLEVISPEYSLGEFRGL